MFAVSVSLYIDASIPPIIQSLKNGRTEFLNFCQSVFGVCNMSDSEKTLKGSFSNPNNEDYLSEKLLLYKKKCSGYAGELTKTINKIEKYLVNNDDSMINNYDKHLEGTISKIIMSQQN